MIQRQAIVTNIKELLTIVSDLKLEGIDNNQKVQLNIINRQKTSDTWKFERELR